MQLYDLLYIISNQFTDAEVILIKEQIESIIQKNKGNIVKTIEIGRRKLSYPIKQDRYGIYFRVFFNLESSNTKKLNQELRLTKNIIRYQIIKAKLLSVKTPSIEVSPTETKTLEEKEELEQGKKEKVSKIKKPKIFLDELDEEKLDKILSHE